jgi:hypothetical protein
MLVLAKLLSLWEMLSHEPARNTPHIPPGIGA